MKTRFKKVIANVLAFALLTSAVTQLPIPLFTQNVLAGQNVGAIINPGFEAGDTSGWATNGTVAADTVEKQDGTYSVKFTAAGSTLTQTVTGIPQGSYTLSAWVKGSTSGNTASMTATNTGAPDTKLLIDGFVNSAAWTHVALRNVLVYNGQCTIAVSSGNGTNLLVDNIQLVLDSDDNNPITNWDLENGLTGWDITGNVTVSAEKKDTGAKAAELSADSQISQTVPVKPDTSYIATVRAKVDRQDVWNKIQQTNSFGKTGELIKVASYGDRINLGVKGKNGTVLRQAPAGLDGYCLLTIAFKTGQNDDQITIYANTINDANYQKSVKAYGTGATQDQWTGNGTDKAYVDNFDLFEIDNSIIKGADVSFLPIIEDKGGKYFANGVQQDCLTIMSNHGVNAITGMIFVDSGSHIYDQSSPKKQQFTSYTDADGNPIPYTMQDGYFGKEHWYGLALRAKELNMGYEPSFHFSDGWMSAAKAFTPVDWMYKDSGGKLVDQSLDEMTTTVYNYVYDFMNGLKNIGVEPSSAKLGNEQDGGIAWPNGKIYSSTIDGFKSLFNAAYDATKAVFPNTSCSFHTNNGYNVDNAKALFNRLITNGIKVDGEAHSLYSGHPSSDILFMGSSNIANFPALDYLNVETGFAVTRYNPDFVDESGSMGQASYYQQNWNGQYNWLLDYMQAHRDLQNPYSRMRGFFYWAAEWIVVEGAGASTLDGNTVDRRTLFNNGDPAFREMGSTADGKMGDMTDGLYAYLWRGCIKDKPTSMQSPLKAFGDYSISAETPISIALVNPSNVAQPQTNLELTEGQTKRLLSKIEPANGALDWEVVWSSSDPAVAAVDKHGFVTALTPGQADITVTTVEGGLSASCTVNVTAAAAVGDGNISVTVNGAAMPATMNAMVWDKIKLKASLPSTATNKVVKYVSSNPEVANFLGAPEEAEEEGVFFQQTDITAGVQLDVKQPGTTVISAVSGDGTAAVQFTLNTAKIPVNNVTLDQSTVRMSTGRAYQLTATVAPANASFSDVIWTSSDTTVATVDNNGQVSSVGTGTAKITVASVDDPAKYAECNVEVVPVMVEGLSLDRSKLNLMINTQKSIIPIITPVDADNKTVVWTSDDAAIAGVDSNGVVTGHVEGTTTIRATASDTSHGTYTAACVVNVQTTPVKVTGVALNKDSFSFKSDYFSTANKPADTPVEKLIAQVAPIDATNEDVIWTSDNETVARVDAFGNVTALKSGNAVITATTADGSYTAACKVLVPVVSESFENRLTGDNWAVTMGSAAPNSAGVFSSEVTKEAANIDNNVLKLSAGGNGIRASQKVFANPIVNGKVIFDFDWNVGAPSASYGGQLSIEDANNKRYLTLETNNNAEMTYSTGGTAANSSIAGTKVGTGFNVNNATYNINATLNFALKTIDLTVTNKANPAITSTINNIPFNAATTYTNSINKIQFVATRSGGMSWSTWIDNLNVYAAAPVPASVSMNKSYLHLLNIAGTRSNTAQLSAVVNPNVSGIVQDVVWSSSNTSVATVSSTGLVTAVPEQSGDVVITAASVADPTLSAACNVKVEGFYPMETLSIYSTNSPAVGIEDSTVNMNTGETLQLNTGTSNDCFIDTIEWVSGDAHKVYVDENGKLYAMAPGLAHISVTVDNYSNNTQISGGVKLTKSVTVNVSGEAILNTFELKNAIQKAIVSKTKPDDYYTQESLTAYTAALNKAQSDLAAAINENWDASRQSTIDQTVTALNAAVQGLTLSSNVTVTGVTLSTANLRVSVGAGRQLTATAAPEYATDKTITWTSDNPAVASVGPAGIVKGIAEGTAVITAQSTNPAVKATCSVTVTKDISTDYLANGGSVSANKSRAQNPPQYALDTDANTAWSTGGASSGADWWLLDLGNIAKIDSLTMNFWMKAKYSVETSVDGQSWHRVVDESAAFAGDTVNFTLNMPANTYGRYIRVNFYAFQSGWVGLVYFQAKGEFKQPAPVIQGIGNKSVKAGDELAFTISANDPLGKTITYSASGLPEGAVLNPATGEFRWTPFTGGSHSVTFTASNGTESISETITIEVNQSTNTAPVINTIGNKQVNIGENLYFEVVATDADGDTLSLSASGLPQGAEFNTATPGAFSWTPDTAGLYPVTFTVSDGQGGSASETVAITVIDPQTPNNPPVFTQLTDQVAVAGQLLVMNVEAVDLDADPLVYGLTGVTHGAHIDTASGMFTWTPQTDGIYTFTFTVSDGKSLTTREISVTVNTPSNSIPVLDQVGDKQVNLGEKLEFVVTATDADGDTLQLGAVGLPQGAEFNTTTPGAFSWTPDTAGLYTVTFNVNDGRGGSASETITITVNDPQNLNNPPVFTQLDDQVAVAGQQLVMNVEAVDLDADPMVYGLTGETHGAHIDAASGIFTWTPQAEGSYRFTFTVSDGRSITTKSITVTVNSTSLNNVPVLNSIGNKSITAGYTLAFTVAATDADNDPITYRAAGLPAGAAFNSATGAFSWTPVSTGTYGITFTAEDGKGGIDSEAVTITVNSSGNSATVPSGSTGGNSGTSVQAVTDKVTIDNNKIIIETLSQTSDKTSVALKADDITKAMEKAAGDILNINVRPVENTKAVKVEIPLKQITGSEKTIVTVTVDTGLAEVSFSTELLKSMENAQKLLIEVNKADTGSLPEEVRKVIGNNPVYDFKLSIDGKEINSFKNSDKLKVEINYQLMPGQNPNNIVAYYINDNGELEVVKNGIFNASTGKVEFSPKHFSKYAAAYAEVKFTDTARATWAQESIEALAAREIVTGTGNNLFNPTEHITRGEFIAMLMNAFDLVDSGAISAFTDVRQGAWYYGAVASAEKLGITAGKADGTFGVNDRITRQDMAVLAYKVSQLVGIKLNSPSELNFKDAGSIAGYAKEAITAMKSSGIINGVGDNLMAPEKNTTRAEAAVIIYNLFKLNK